MSRSDWLASGPHLPIDPDAVHFPIRLPKPIKTWRKADFTAGFFERLGFVVRTEETPEGYVVILTGLKDSPAAP